MPTAKTTDGYFHPTQKPIDLIRRYIIVHTKPNDVVLDPFCGSASTIIAAIRERRQWIGIEKDEKYFNIAKKRIETELSQPTLF